MSEKYLKCGVGGCKNSVCEHVSAYLGSSRATDCFASVEVLESRNALGLPAKRVKRDSVIAEEESDEEKSVTNSTSSVVDSSQSSEEEGSSCEEGERKFSRVLLDCERLFVCCVVLESSCDANKG